MLAGNQFEPAALLAAPGTTVTWTWDDGATLHDVVFEDGPSSPVQSEGTWTRTFDAPGTYDYVCTLHGQMTGTVTIGREAGSRTQPDGSRATLARRSSHSGSRAHDSS